MSKFVEFEVDGINLVHVMSPLGGAEHSICGFAFDEHMEESPHTTEFIQTKKRTVTCPKCIAVIKHVRHVKIK